MQKLRARVFRRLWVKDTRHPEIFSDEKCYLNRSTRVPQIIETATLLLGCPFSSSFLVESENCWR